MREDHNDLRGKDQHAERAAREGISRPEAKLKNYMETYGADGKMNEWARYHRHLGKIADDDLNYIKRKDVQYKGSWKRRGGTGAFFTIVRPWDRLEGMLAEPRVRPIDAKSGDLSYKLGESTVPLAYAPFDIFEAIAAEGLEGKDGSIIACVRDLRRYLLLVEAEMTERLVPERMVPRTSADDEPLKITLPKKEFEAGAADSDKLYHFPYRISKKAHAEQVINGFYDAWSQLMPDLYRLDPALITEDYEALRPAVKPVYVQAGTCWVLDMLKMPHDLRSTYPTMQRELNNKEYEETRVELRGMYSWDEPARKWVIRPQYEAWLPGGGR